MAKVIILPIDLLTGGGGLGHGGGFGHGCTQCQPGLYMMKDIFDGMRLHQGTYAIFMTVWFWRRRAPRFLRLQRKDLSMSEADSEDLGRDRTYHIQQSKFPLPS